MANPRQKAAALIARILQDRDTLASLPSVAATEDAADNALIRELCLGTCRQYPQLQSLLDALTDKPLKKKDSDITALILIGLYQLFFMRVPDHAAINETVSCVRKPWARGLVNAVLRNALRNFPNFPDGFSQDPAFHYAHPPWLVKEIMNAWSGKAGDILLANNLRAPLTLRINRQKTDRAGYLHLLEEESVPASEGKLCETSVILESGHDVSRLPGYAEGLFSVQDEASQLVPLCLDAGPEMRVLDACAAPGGKTAALLEHQPRLDVTAVDNEPRRLERMRSNLDRLQLKSQVSFLLGDAASPDTFRGMPAFDRILIDAPCSATGVIRRHPDIKVVRTPGQVDALVGKQEMLLEALWPMLKPGGLMLYTTCSVLPRENSQQIAGFLDRHADAREQPLPFLQGETCEAGRQLLPGSHGQDGFYYALMRKSC